MVELSRRQSVADCPIRGDYQTTKTLSIAEIAGKLGLETYVSVQILNLPFSYELKQQIYANLKLCYK